MNNSQNRKVMCLDLGTKTIGVAVSDDLLITAQPVETVRRKTLAEDLDTLAKLAHRHRITEVVLGLPINMDGSRGGMARRAESFSRRLEGRLELPIVLWDERLSTAGAERSLLESGMSRAKRKTVIDQVAAALILQSYLDSLRRSGSDGEPEGNPGGPGRC